MSLENVLPRESLVTQGAHEWSPAQVYSMEVASQPRRATVRLPAQCADYWNSLTLLLAEGMLAEVAELCTSRMCFLRMSLRVKVLGQLGHEKRRSLLCTVRMWRFRSWSRFMERLHTGHSWLPGAETGGLCNGTVRMELIH